MICVHSLNNFLINPKHLDFLATDKANVVQTIEENLVKNIKRMKINIVGGYSILQDNPKAVERLLREFCLSRLPPNVVF
jgi:hypothetical protein